MEGLVKHAWGEGISINGDPDLLAKMLQSFSRGPPRGGAHNFEHPLLNPLRGRP